jgi:hypothetical protein
VRYLDVVGTYSDQVEIPAKRAEPRRVMFLWPCPSRRLLRPNEGFGPRYHYIVSDDVDKLKGLHELCFPGK